MISKKEILGSLILFLTIYFIIYADHRLNKKCECDNCYLTSKNVSIKIPLLVTIIGFIIYKLVEPYVYSYISGNSVIKQNIITDMADF
jgi:hypothetical protein